jgi:hypothetical protein
MKTDKAFKRVIKKLSAVRATLPNDEREVLDEIVTTTPEEQEVEGHRMTNLQSNASKTSAKQGTKNQVKAHRLTISPTASKTSAKQGAKNQVKGHRLTISPTASKTSAKQGAKNQVKAHRMTTSPTASKSSIKQTVKNAAKDE